MAHQQLSTNTFTAAKWVVSPDPTQGTHTTIQAAINAASAGDTIFLRPGTYTENPTLQPGINLTAYACDAFTPNVTINGTPNISAIFNTSLSSGTGSSISIGAAATLSIQICAVNNSNINAIDGSGNLFYGAVTFSMSSTLSGALSVTALTTRPP